MIGVSAMRKVMGFWVAGWLLATSTLAWAELEVGEQKTIDPKVTYPVTYQVSQAESKTLASVEVFDVVQVGSRSFLLVHFKGFGDKKAYLDLEAVRSIIQQ